MSVWGRLSEVGLLHPCLRVWTLCCYKNVSVLTCALVCVCACACVCTCVCVCVCGGDGGGEGCIRAPPDGSGRVHECKQCGDVSKVGSASN